MLNSALHPNPSTRFDTTEPPLLNLHFPKAGMRNESRVDHTVTFPRWSQKRIPEILESILRSQDRPDEQFLGSSAADQLGEVDYRFFLRR